MLTGLATCLASGAVTNNFATMADFGLMHLRVIFPRCSAIVAASLAAPRQAARQTRRRRSALEGCPVSAVYDYEGAAGAGWPPWHQADPQNQGDVSESNCTQLRLHVSQA